MKYINPEKSCVLDVGEKRAGELERSGWKPYFEAEAPKIKVETAPKVKAVNKTSKGKTTNKTNKGKSK